MEDYPHYPTSFVMRSVEPSTLRIVDVWKFKSTKSNKWYIVEMEHFDFNLIAIKFYYKGVKSSKLRYSLMTNDNEPRRIVYTCLDLMRRYYLKDDTVSFGFVAANDLDEEKLLKPGNRRFRLYRTLVNNYFGNQTFVHLHDGNQRLYLLLNKRQLVNGKMWIIDIKNLINDIYGNEFNFSWD